MALTHQQMLDFVHKQTKAGLDKIQHFDAGGTVLGGPGSGATTSNATNPNTGVLGTINGAIGLNNNFQAGQANIQQGTNAAQLNAGYQGVQSGLGQQQNLSNQLQPGVAQGINSQARLSQQLGNEAEGNGPNPAQAALNQSTGQNIAQQAALAAGQRGAGANVGMIAAQNAQQGAATQQQAVGQAATLQAQQQLAAQQAQQNLAGQQVGQGATAIQNVNQQQQNEQNILQGANTSYNNANVSQQANLNNVNSQTSAANQNMAANTFGGILSGGGGISALKGLFAHGGMVKLDKKGSPIDSNHQIPASGFALGGSRYPIHNEEHAKVSMAHAAQNGTPSEQQTVKNAVKKKFPGMKMKKMAEGGEVSGDDTPAFQPTPSNSSSGPSVPSTSSLPADTTNFSQAAGGGSSGGGGGGGGGLMALAALAEGGSVQQPYMTPTPLIVNPNGPQSFVGQWLNSSVAPSAGPQVGTASALPENKRDFSKDAAKDQKQSQSQEQGSVSAGPQSGSDSSNPVVNDFSNYAADGGKIKAKDDAEKAVKKDDSYDNDKIPTMLSEGEIVIPRHIAMHQNAPAMAAQFVAHTLAKRGKK